MCCQNLSERWRLLPCTRPPSSSAIDPCRTGSWWHSLWPPGAAGLSARACQAGITPDGLCPWEARAAPVLALQQPDVLVLSNAKEHSECNLPVSTSCNGKKKDTKQEVRDPLKGDVYETAKRGTSSLHTRALQSLRPDPHMPGRLGHRPPGPALPALLQVPC